MSRSEPGLVPAASESEIESTASQPSSRHARYPHRVRISRPLSACIASAAPLWVGSIKIRGVKVADIDG